MQSHLPASAETHVQEEQFIRQVAGFLVVCGSIGLLLCVLLLSSRPTESPHQQNVHFCSKTIHSHTSQIDWLFLLLLPLLLLQLLLHSLCYYCTISVVHKSRTPVRPGK